MMISPTWRRNASPHAAARAASRLDATRIPGAAKAGSRLTTMLVRPASGLPIERKVLRPIMTGLPIVIARKCCMSDLSRHGSALPRPITPFSDTAATRVMFSMRRPPSFTCHARTRCGHPRLLVCTRVKDVDGRVKPGHNGLHRHSGLDMRMRLVTFEREILVAEREKILDRGIDPQRRQRPRLAGELQARLLEMIQIKVRVAERVYESARP